MVNSEAQLYTMEGIAAGVIMILTAYLVLGSTSVYTPGDTHITDMQLEQVGSDVLKIMDTPPNTSSISELQQIVATNDGPRFHQLFWETYLMSGEIAAQKTTRTGSSIITNATVYYHYTDMTDPMYPLGKPAVAGYQLSRPIIPYSGSEPGVRVTRYVNITSRNTIPSSSCCPSGPPFCDPACPRMPDTLEDRPQVVLVEVFMWKA
jgi:hypothetical protein